MDVGDDIEDTRSGLVIQCSYTSVKDPVRFQRQHLIIFGVEQSCSSDPTVGIAGEYAVEGSKDMDTHQSQTLLAIEAKCSVVIVHSHLTIAVVIRMVLLQAGSVLLKLIGFGVGLTVGPAGSEHAEGGGGERLVAVLCLGIRQVPPLTGGVGCLAIIETHILGVHLDPVKSNQTSKSP